MTPGPHRYDPHLDLHLTSLPPWMVSYLIKGVALSLVGLLAFLCRTKTTDRRDPRLLGEIALVVLTMLFISERSWKHHYVTVLIPYTYLVCEFFSSRVGPRSRMLLVGSWGLSFVLMLATSTEVGGIFANGEGHEIAQGYGFFLWAGVVLVHDGCLARLGSPIRNAGFGHARARWPISSQVSSQRRIAVTAGRHVLNSGNLLVF